MYCAQAASLQKLPVQGVIDGPRRAQLACVDGMSDCYSCVGSCPGVMSTRICKVYDCRRRSTPSLTRRIETKAGAVHALQLRPKKFQWAALSQERPDKKWESLTQILGNLYFLICYLRLFIEAENKKSQILGQGFFLRN